MKILKWWRIGPVVGTILVAGIAGLMPRSALSADSTKPAACSAPEHLRFDYWAGDWDAFDIDNPLKSVARTRVDRILDGCVLFERYEGTDGFQGQSFTTYDASRKVWHQTWVTDRGQLLIIEGGIQAGEMVLAGVDRAATGKERQVRVVWKPADGGVRETAVTSIDGGKTWNPWFDLMFRAHKT